MAIAKGITVRIYKGATTGTAMTNEAMTDSGDHMRYRITNRAKRYWNRFAALTVRVAGIIVTTGFTVEYPGGEVVFTSSQGAQAVTVTGEYIAIEKSTLVQNASMKFAWLFDDITCVGDTAMRNHPIVLTGQLTFTSLHEDDTFFSRLGEPYIMVYSEDGTYQAGQIDSGHRYEAFMTLQDNKIDGFGKGKALRDNNTLATYGQVYVRSD